MTLEERELIEEFLNTLERFKGMTREHGLREAIDEEIKRYETELSEDEDEEERGVEDD